jgi:hypothetical protein
MGRSDLSKVSIISSTSPFSVMSTDQHNSSLNNDSRIDLMVKEMRAELLVGTMVRDNYIKSGVVSMQVSTPFLAAGALNALEMDGLKACAHLHRDFLIESIIGDSSSSSHSASDESNVIGSRVPIMIIAAGPYSTTHDAICTILRNNGADTPRLILSQIIISRNNIHYWRDILSTYGCTLCVDCFGYSGSFLPPTGPMFPSDEEVKYTPYIYILYLSVNNHLLYF